MQSSQDMNGANGASGEVNAKKLYVGNLAFSMTDDTLRDTFAQFGEVVDAKVITDFRTGRSKGFGFVEFAEEAQAQAAIEGLHETEVEGRTIFVKVAMPKKPREDRGGFSRGPRRDFRGGGDNYNRGPRRFDRNDRGDRGGYDN